MADEEAIIYYIANKIKVNPEIKILLVADTFAKALAIELKVNTLLKSDTGNIYPFGIGGFTYGHRADLAVMVNAITEKNVHESEKQIKWFIHELLTRTPHKGQLIVFGKPIAPNDFYFKLQKLNIEKVKLMDMIEDPNV